MVVIHSHVHQPYWNNDSYSYFHKSILFRLNVCNVWVVVGCWSLGIAMSHYWSWLPSIADGSKQCSEAMFTTIPHPTHAAHTYTTLSLSDSYINPFVLFLTLVETQMSGLSCFTEPGSDYSVKLYITDGQNACKSLILLWEYWGMQRFIKLRKMSGWDSFAQYTGV